jgi:hypothetical protein
MLFLVRNGATLKHTCTGSPQKGDIGAFLNQPQCIAMHFCTKLTQKCFVEPAGFNQWQGIYVQK